MYKLTVISGPNVGTSYALQEGEVSIGRQAGNVIVLHSAKVSKKHCVLKVANGEVLVLDQNSSNGTFVNGVQAKSKELHPGDRISVGDYVFELRQPAAQSQQSSLPALGIGNVIPFPKEGKNPAAPVGSSDFTGEFSSPKDFKSKILWFFESYLMPFFYNLNLKTEWKTISIFAITVFLLLNLLISVFPLLMSNRTTVLKESAKRARVIAKQIVENNSAALASEAESKMRIGVASHDVGIRVAKILDLSNRILAPAEEMNRYFSYGEEAAFAVKMAKLYEAGREEGAVQQVADGVIAAIEPIKVFHSQLGKNVVAGMVVVSIDGNLATMGLGEAGLVYSKVFILTAILATLFFMVLYRLTLKPLEILNSDLDRALKGESTQIKQDFQFQEISSLWDLINSALHRIPKENMSEQSSFNSDTFEGAEEFVNAFQSVGQFSKLGIAVCDDQRKILYLNPIFEEISGIHTHQAQGQNFSEVARDQALVALCEDIFDRATPQQEPIVEEFEFSGNHFKIYGVALGKVSLRGYVITAVREEV